MQLNSEHQNWLISQKITEKVIEDFGLYTNKNDLIVFPVLDITGEFLFNKYRVSPLSDAKPKYTYDKGGKVSLYGIDKIGDSKSVLITEGEKDCLASWSCNIPAVTSTGGAMSFQEEWAILLQGKEVTLCFDNDFAGGEGMAKTAKILGLENVRIIFLPDRPGVKDISDYIAGGGDLGQLMKTARVISDVEEDRANRKSIWLSTFFHDSWIKNNRQRSVSSYVPDEKIKDEILKAKQFPITDLIEFKQGKAHCLWHNEKTASLNYYPKTNSCFCFGCFKAVDAIEVARQKHGLSFKEAIKFLNK